MRTYFANNNTYQTYKKLGLLDKLDLHAQITKYRLKVLKGYIMTKTRITKGIVMGLSMYLMVACLVTGFVLLFVNKPTYKVLLPIFLIILPISFILYQVRLAFYIKDWECTSLYRNGDYFCFIADYECTRFYVLINYHVECGATTGHKTARVTDRGEDSPGLAVDLEEKADSIKGGKLNALVSLPGNHITHRLDGTKDKNNNSGLGL